MNPIILAVIFLLGGSALSSASAALNNQDLVDRLRLGGKNRGPLQRMTAILPDTPFLQLRNGADSGEAATSNGSKENPKIVRLRRGQSGVLQCEVLGMPSPVAYWTKDGILVSSADQSGRDPSEVRQSSNLVEMITNNGRPTLEHAVTLAKLKLKCVSPSDAGLYECNGDNGVEKMVAYTKVIIEGDPADSSDCLPNDNAGSAEVAPFIYMYTEMRLEYPNNDAQLICRADGYPRPTIRWFDSNEMPIKSGHNFTLLANGDLLVKRINFGMHHPFRQFSCQAFNSLGTDAAVIDLLAISRSK